MLIGNYVHYKYSNYVKYGINYPRIGSEGGTATNASAALEEQKQKFKERSLNYGNSENIKRQLETQLNFFFNPTDQKTLEALKITPAQAEQIQQQIMQILSNSATSAMQKATINYGDLSAYASSKSYIADASLQSQVNRFRKLSERKTTFGALQSRIISLFSYRDNLKNPGKMPQALQKLFNDYETLMKEIRSMSGSFSGFNSNQYYISAKQKNVGFVKALNEAIQSVKVSGATQALGDVAELVPAVTQYVLQNFLNQNTNQLMVGFNNIKGFTVVGNQRSAKVVDASRFIGAGSGGGKGGVAQFLGGEVNVSYTQDKVDVNLILEDGKTIAASVKNIADTDTSIHVLKGSSILKYLQDADPSFVNHYLNISAEHPDGISPMLGQMHEVVKSMIALGALSGGLLSQTSSGGSISKGSEAEIFVVNTHGTGQGHYSVYFINDIVDKIIENSNLVDIKGFNEPKTWENGWYGGPELDSKKAYKRIAGLLAQLHTFQLEVSISRQALI